MSVIYYSDILAKEIAIAIAKNDDIKYKLYYDALSMLVNISRIECASELNLLLMPQFNQTLH